MDNLSDPANTTLQHHINQAIKARGVMQRDVDYVVRDGQIVIVDEFTGRLMFGRRYNEGLHQAIEAKEGVKVQHESKTLATITFQNYFRLYGKLSGMTGTALTEEEEFRHTYKLDVIEIPTNKPVARKDNPDSVYKNERGKIHAAIGRIEACHAKGQPILVGTVSIEKVRGAEQDPQGQGHQAHGSQRQVPREGSRDRRAGGHARARSRSRPTWPAVVPTSCSAATPRPWRSTS